MVYVVLYFSRAVAKERTQYQQLIWLSGNHTVSEEEFCMQLFSLWEIEEVESLRKPPT